MVEVKRNPQGKRSAEHRLEPGRYVRPDTDITGFGEQTKQSSLSF